MEKADRREGEDYLPALGKPQPWCRERGIFAPHLETTVAALEKGGAEEMEPGEAPASAS